MRNEVQKFHETVGILVKAYLCDTLMHGECAACAVGNIIAQKVGATLVKDEFGELSWNRGGLELTVGWQEVFATRYGQQYINENAYFGQVRRQIDASGYSWRELARIEFSFEQHAQFDECGDQNGNIEEQMFNGLMAVVDVLADIHKIDLSQKEQAKALFVK